MLSGRTLHPLIDLPQLGAVGSALADLKRRGPVCAASSIRCQRAKVGQPAFGIRVFENAVPTEACRVCWILQRLPRFFGGCTLGKAMVACLVVAQESAALILPIV